MRYASASPNSSNELMDGMGQEGVGSLRTLLPGIGRTVAHTGSPR